MASATLGSTHSQLPTELVLLIVDHLANDNGTLCTLARTNRALQHFAEEHIYKTIELFTVRDLHNIIEAFAHRYQRVRAVQTLKLQYHYNEKDLDDNVDIRKTFNECIAHMVNLREWHIESPYDNCHWDDGPGPQQWVKGDMKRFREALDLACTKGPLEAERILAERRIGNDMDRTVGLALLESLTIHSHGVDTDFWDLDAYHCLFQHPTLRHLHISCVSLTEDLPALRTHIKKSPLTTLVFDECELSPQSLKAILRTPVRLKNLTLGENVWNTKRSKRLRPRLTQNANEALEALKQVAHSLESLTHHDPSWKLDRESYRSRRMNPSGEGLRNFHALVFLQCETMSFLHQTSIMNREMAPPNLETLRLMRHWFVAADFFDHMPEIETYLALPSLTTLELLQASHCWLELSIADYICEAERLRNRHAYAYKFYKAGINLKVLIQMHRDDRIIPPYLHGEATPVIECLYDAHEIGFRRHIRDPTELTALNMRREPPETDQLGVDDVHIIEGQNRRTLSNLKHHFIRHRRLRRASSILELVDDDNEGEDAFEDGVDEEYDEDDLDVDMDEDDMGGIFHEQDGQLYIEVYGSESESEEGDEVVEGVVGGVTAEDELD
ncbi:hypothetical protein EK21DRAFT_82544 [Setomelanomma holmii]|uniref:F-box domain-containing protein n=1 Tax=Setomelanomma holmii TaxID=210430 RepID=A0A9P4GW03_9PLEO|nr:hypothetical protein EK21DRAFT_82544 [Setomelanomma holmii]